jgi:MFS family permease
MALLVKDIREFGRFQRNARLYLITVALSYAPVGIILVLYNLYLSALGYKADFIGLVLFMGAVGAGIAIFPAGICIDRFGGKWVMIWSSVLIGFAGAGQFLLRQPLPLLVTAFIAGIGAAFQIVVTAPFLTAHSDPEERSLLFSFVIVISLAMTVLGEVLGGILPTWFRTQSWAMSSLPIWFDHLLVSQPLARSYQLSLLLAGVIAIPSFIPLFLMSNDRPSVPASTKERQTSVWSWQAARTTIRRWQQIGIRALLMSPLVAMTLFWLLLGMGAGMIIPYFNLYFVQHLGASPALFGIIDGCANAFNALCTLLAPLLMLRLGRMRTLLLPRIASLPIMLIIGLTSWLPLAAILYPIRQCLMDMSNGILQALAMEVAGRRRGLANSSYQVAFQGSQAITTPLGGLLIVRVGYSAVFMIAVALYLLGLLLLWGRFARKNIVIQAKGPLDHMRSSGPFA